MASRLGALAGPQDLALTPMQMNQAQYNPISPGFSSGTIAPAPYQTNPVASQVPLPPGMPPPPGASSPTAPTSGGTTTTTPPAASPTTPAAPNYQDAFNNFKDFIGYDFALKEAMKALNHQYAAAGQLQSGAAAKGIADYAINMAQQMAAFPYLNYLGGQQNMGAQAGSAVAGVGSNFGNTAANINANMGGAIQSGANANSNAAIVNGIANANMWSGVGSALGNLGSSFINSQQPVFGGVPASSGPINVTGFGSPQTFG